MEIVQKAIETRQSCKSDLQERYKVHKCRYGVEFSTNNSSTSLFDHWLLYCHCPKLLRLMRLNVNPNESANERQRIKPL